MVPGHVRIAQGSRPRTFLRLKLGKDLESRRLLSRVFESADEALRNPKAPA